MGRSPCCSKEGLNRGAWTAQEDDILRDYIRVHGEGGWRNLPKNAGLKRCGKSCRLRWLNYLRPDIKRGNISEDEEELIIRLHKLLGNRWSLIAVGYRGEQTMKSRITGTRLWTSSPDYGEYVVDLSEFLNFGCEEFRVNGTCMGFNSQFDPVSKDWARSSELENSSMELGSLGFLLDGEEWY
ncbi:unnamed protein product [Rhodiola kirilowii]